MQGNSAPTFTDYKIVKVMKKYYIVPDVLEVNTVSESFLTLSKTDDPADPDKPTLGKERDEEEIIMQLQNEKDEDKSLW